MHEPQLRPGEPPVAAPKVFPSYAEPSSRAALVAVVAGMLLFLVAMIALVCWVATLPEKAAAAGTAGRTIALAAPAAPASPAASPAAPSAALPAAPPLPAEAEREEPGLSLTFTRGGASDTRTARLVSLDLPAGAAPTPFLDAGPFTATWEGNLNLRIRDSYAFVAQGRGKLTVTINDKPALEVSGEDFSQKPGEALRLNKGKNHLVVKYENPPSGAARVRVLWQMKGELLPEPPPPSLFTHNAGTTSAMQGQRLRDGRFLLAQLRCTKCHAVPAAPPVVPATPADAAKPGPMPELAMDVPNLTDAGARLNREWIAAWVADPHALRPDAHMPRVFKTAKGAVPQEAADVAAYLASLGAKGGSGDAAPKQERVENGGQLFASLNCLACHTAPDAAPGNGGAAAAAPDAAASPAGDNAGDAPSGDAPPPRVPLSYVRAKFKVDALKQYLLNPSVHYAWNPMPNFRLSAQEADDLTAYLWLSAPEKSALASSSAPGDAGKGQQLVASAGCLNCHAIGNEKSTAKPPALAEIPKDGWAKGLAKDADFHSAGPHYELTDDQRSAIVAFAATDRSSLERDAHPEFAERQIAAMRCTACHARDGRESLLATAFDQEQKDLEGKYPPPQPANAEAFSPDQRPPLLTWAGEKLRPEWMASFIGGKIPYKPRPYLRARMPAFTVRAAWLAVGLVEEHGYAPTSPDYPKPDAAMASIGQKLTGKTPNEAFACIQCHAVASAPPFAPFEAPAINFAYARERLQKDYYHRWVHNPLRIDPNSKMPAFEHDDGKTSITTVYDGDARKQFEAIWQYLLNGPDIKPPAE